MELCYIQNSDVKILTKCALQSFNAFFHGFFDRNVNSPFLWSLFQRTKLSYLTSVTKCHMKLVTGQNFIPTPNKSQRIEDVFRIDVFSSGCIVLCSFTFLLHSTHVRCVIDCAKIVRKGRPKRKKMSEKSWREIKLYEQYMFSLSCFCFIVGFCRFD